MFQELVDSLFGRDKTFFWLLENTRQIGRIGRILHKAAGVDVELRVKLKSVLHIFLGTFSELGEVQIVGDLFVEAGVVFVALVLPLDVVVTPLALLEPVSDLKSHLLLWGKLGFFWDCVGVCCRLCHYLCSEHL